jgi:hypothetical protein
MVVRRPVLGMPLLWARADVNKPSIETQENSALPECSGSSRRVGTAIETGQENQ